MTKVAALAIAGFVALAASPSFAQSRIQKEQRAHHRSQQRAEQQRQINNRIASQNAPRSTNRR